MEIRQRHQEFIVGEERPFDSAHASTLVLLKDWTVVASWFGGSWEKASDVAIWVSRRVNGIWEAPKKAADAKNIATWNPVLFVREDESIILFYKVGETIPVWKTWYVESHDGGRTFSQPKELVEGDEQGGRGPVKNKPIRLTDGTVLAPASIEGEYWDAFVDISEDDCRTWTMSEMVPARRCSAEPRIIDRPYHPQHLYGKGLIQPTLWQDGAGDVHMLLRTTSSRIFRSDSADGGRTWSVAYDTGLPNNNSGIDLTAMPNGDLVLVYNPRENLPGHWKGPRTPLSVAVSKDNGKSFQHLADLENGVGSFCYPAVICAGPGKVMITYTWNRKTIVFAELEYED